MSKISKIILAILALIFIAVFVKFTHQSFYDEIFLTHNCWSEKQVKESQFYGRVTKIYIDSSDHNFNTIIIENNNHRYVVVLTDKEETELYYAIKINDSIRKEFNSLRFYLKHNAGNKTDTIVVKYKCKL